jgi:hypothetical protein
LASGLPWALRGSSLRAARRATRQTLIADLHAWRVGRATHAGTLSVGTHEAGLTPNPVREWLAVHEETVRATIEIHRCEDNDCT